MTKQWAVHFQFRELPSPIANQSAVVKGGTIGVAIKRGFEAVRKNIKGRRITEAIITVKKVTEVKLD